MFVHGEGVEVSHQNLAALLGASAGVFRFTSADAWAYLHSYAFDFSVWELWGALYHGARLVILPRSAARAPDDLFDALVRFEVSVLNQTPSAFAQLQAALERQIRWTSEFAAAGDLESAVDARLDADAIGDELSAGPMP